jgi:hypothetical protein
VDSKPVSCPCVYGGSYSCALLFTSIPILSPLIEISLLQDHPSKHGLPIEVNLPILFPSRGMYDHDDSNAILVWTLALACLIT